MSLRCPRCRVPLNQVTVRGLSVDLCPQCDGTWYDGDELVQLLEAPYSTVAGSELGPALIQDVAPPEDREALPCPRCRNAMSRYPFLEGCAVMADGCAYHGVWLDDGELSKLFEHLRQGDRVARDSFSRRKDEATLMRVAESGAEGGGVLAAIAGLFRKARG
ncbi:MAG: zf-TFIIB domain-containing protein [Candidatus Eremiobacterota bacterium]